ncbi:MAG: energy transducer TonB [Sphingomicrobium sp.]
MRNGFVIACAAVAPATIAASEPVRLQPSSRWVLDYAANSCRLSRIFGQGGDTVIFLLESDGPGDMDMLVTGTPVAGGDEDIPARFLPVQGKPMKGLAAKSTSTGEPAILWSTVDLYPDDVAARKEKAAAERRAHRGVRPPPRDIAEEAADKLQRQDFATKVSEVEIEARPGHPVILETGSLGQAIETFDECSRDSLRDWGVDPDLEEKIVRPIWAPNVAEWFRPEDYPPDMLDQGQQSVVKVRVLVDASGRVTKCTSLSHFKAPQFNQIVCNNFTKRARFEPAELADGTKVASYYATQINWRIGH